MATATAALGAVRAAWVLLRKRRKQSPDEIDRVRSRTTTWLKRAAAHFVTKGLRHRWLLYYGLEVYVSTIYRKHEKLTVPGRVELPIDRCYIPLELRAGHMTEAIQLLNKSGTVLLLGDPGTGKSALLSMILRTLCRSAHHDREHARLPIYGRLQQLVGLLAARGARDATPEGAFETLKEWFNSSVLRPMDLFDSDEMITTFAQRPRNGLVVLFDGLDEIDAEAMGEVERFLSNLAQYFGATRGRNLLVVASRRQALDFAPGLAGGGIANVFTVELKPFTPAAIYSFLLRWPYRSGTRAAAEARRIFNSLRLNPTLIETCANPLALALYVNHDQRLRELGPTSGSTQPDTRAAFFNDVIDYLMIRTRVEKSGAPAPIRPFRQARTSFFVAVVDDHIRSDDPFNVISEERMLKHAEGLTRTGQTAEQALYELAKDTGLIVRSERRSTWHFIHRSFLDYFLACSLAAVSRRREIQNLLSVVNSHPLRYLEGFYFACGLMASRNSLHLNNLLRDVGSSTFVGRYYPRAMLEAQAYFMPGFVERIKFYCDLWKRNSDDVVLFRDLVAVIVDYERSSEALGREAEVGVQELGEAFTDRRYAELRAARLDVELALKIADEDSLAGILLAGSVDDAVVALFEPVVAERLRQPDIEQNPRLAAIVAETALRSSLYSTDLAPAPRPVILGRPPFSHRDEPWADVWSVRGTRLGATLAVALPYVRGLPLEEQADFPHLAVLSYARPIRRLRYELIFGDRRFTMLLAALSVATAGSLWLFGVHPLLIGLATVGLVGALLWVLRLAALRGVVILPSARILDLRPVGGDIVFVGDPRVRLVAGDRGSLRRWVVGKPKSSDGRIFALYVREMPLLWRRFCPKVGDRRLSLAGCAAVEQMWTEDVRKLLRG